MYQETFPGKNGDISEGAQQTLLNLVSWAILLELEQQQLQDIADLIDGLYYNSDILLETLLAARLLDRSIPNDLCAPPKFFKKLVAAVNESDEKKRFKLLASYRKSWLKVHVAAGIGTPDSKHNVYSGFWAFELAAFMKIWNIDDTSFKHKKYYPYDLVKPERWSEAFPVINSDEPWDKGVYGPHAFT